MAFFAVMLPDALKDSRFAESLKASFNKMPDDALKKEQANMVKLGQLIRDAVVAVSLEKGTSPPPISTAPTIAAVSGPRKFTSDQDVWNEWKAMEKYRQSKEEAPKGYSSTPSYKIIDKVSQAKAEGVISEFLSKRPDLSKEKEVMDVLNRALADLEFKDDPGRQKQQQGQQGQKQQQNQKQNQQKKKGGRYRTPRKTGGRKTYKRY